MKFNIGASFSIALKTVINVEHDRLVNAEILKKVISSDWATPIVPIPKKGGKIRIASDYKVTGNQSLIVDQHSLPTPELFVTLIGGQQLSKLNVSRTYQQMLLDEDSHKYVTINTYKGLFRYTCLF